MACILLADHPGVNPNACQRWPDSHSRGLNFVQLEEGGGLKIREQAALDDRPPNDALLTLLYRFGLRIFLLGSL